MDDEIKEILSNFEFLSYGRMGEIFYLGIIQNSDNQLVSMYVMNMIPD